MYKSGKIILVAINSATFSSFKVCYRSNNLAITGCCCVYNLLNIIVFIHVMFIFRTTEKLYFSNLTSQKQLRIRSFWKTVSPLFLTKGLKGDKIFFNENDKCVSNDDEYVTSFVDLFLTHF